MRDARYWEHVARHFAFVTLQMPTAPFVYICTDLEEKLDAERQEEAKHKLGVK